MLTRILSYVMALKLVGIFQAPRSFHSSQLRVNNVGCVSVCLLVLEDLPSFGGLGVIWKILL